MHPPDESLLGKIKINLEHLANTNDRVVLILNRFDRLLPIFNQSLFDNLRFLRDVDRKKIVLIFVSSRALIELKPEALKDNVSLIADTLFLKPYSKEDLLQITKIDNTHVIKPLALELSGGHHALFHTLLNCQNLNLPLSDPMVEMLIGDMYSTLHAREQETIRHIASKKSGKIEPYLLNTGIINPDGEIFTPLLEKYVQIHTKATLPHKERLLLNILKKNRGRLVRKNEIIAEVWGDEVVGDWALNSLVYRLRRHPAFDTNRYSIKSVKKDGYILIDSTK